MDIEMDPIDTMMVDTMTIDTMILENPCDSNLVYFEMDVLPIFLGSCAYSGCHDAITAADGVILDNYQNIISTGEIIPFDLSESKVYELITEDDLDEVMPPSGPLTNEQISQIAKWILQGAENLECDEEVEPCDTNEVSYNNFVSIIMQTSCNGCHATGVGSGGVITDTYTHLKLIADNGRLFGAINWDSNFTNMPQGQDQLEPCVIDKIKSWIDAGAQNN